MLRDPLGKMSGSAEMDCLLPQKRVLHPLETFSVVEDLCVHGGLRACTTNIQHVERIGEAIAVTLRTLSVHNPLDTIHPSFGFAI